MRQLSRSKRLWLAAFMGLAGAIWLLQGTGYIRGSAMTGQPIWAIAGMLLVIFAIVLAWTARRGSSGPPP